MNTRTRIGGVLLLLSIAVGISLMACDESGGPTVFEPESAELTYDGAATLSKGTSSCKEGKIEICHVPPGSLENVHQICVSAKAWPSHEDHGDHLPLSFWLDEDSDGFGAGDVSTGCLIPDGFVGNNDDCDDEDASIHPDAEEVCDEVDNNCDGSVDEGLTCAECVEDADCDNGVFCDGAESCDAGTCQDGTPVDCDDGISCTIDSCDETDDLCENIGDDGLCPSGDFDCTQPQCDAVLGCQYPSLCEEAEYCCRDVCIPAGEVCNPL